MRPGRLKTIVTNNKTKEAPAATGKLNKTDKQKTTCGNGAGNNKQVQQNKTNASGYRAGWIKSIKYPTTGAPAAAG